MPRYENLSQTLIERMTSEKQDGSFLRVGFLDECAIRRKQNSHDNATVLRSNFIRDVDKILNCPYYNRYADKTQVLSFYHNDDISHRSLHVQLVSRIARTIGKALNLNTELIEAIALGHDLGHTPFGHTGEKILDKLYFANTSRRFAHNIHSVRVLQDIFPLNVTLQTLDGIASHNGEIELSEYAPTNLENFEQFDSIIENCYLDYENNKKMIPCTLEGCVVRISDIIAYLGKDRQDAENNNLVKQNEFLDYGIGIINAEIVNNLMVNIIENSYGKPYIKLDKAHFDALKKAKEQNYENIYKNEKVTLYENDLQIIMEKIYYKLLNDLKTENKSSPIFAHHVEYLNKPYYTKKRSIDYIDTEKNQIVVDFVASMTDDYMIELYNFLFPNTPIKINYKHYF